MSLNPWQSIHGSMTHLEAKNTDNLLRLQDCRRHLSGHAPFPGDVARMPFAPAFRDNKTVAWVPTAEPRADLADLADHLSTVALERKFKAVVPNHLYQSGVQRFGFCCERVTG